MKKKKNGVASLLLAPVIALVIALVIIGFGMFSPALPGVPVQIAAPQEDMPTEGNAYLGAYYDPEKGYIPMSKSPYSAEEVQNAAEELIAAGALTEAEWAELNLDMAASRALFIRLICGAAGAPIPAADTSIPGEQWYAPYVKAGYAQGMFGADGTEMSFTPTDGFFMGEAGYREMEQPISRADALYILDHTVLNQTTLQPEDGDVYGDSYLAVGQAVMCALDVLHGEPVPRAPASAVPTAQEAILAGRRIVHAGGEISAGSVESYTYSNSAEALVNAYRMGNRVIEIDFTQTTDGHLACIHGWSPKRSQYILKDVPIPLEEWMGLKVYEVLTPMCLESLAGFMREHPDLYIVTDVKDDNQKAAAIIAQTCPDLLDRFIVQIYGDEQYDAIRNQGFQNMIYTFYDLSLEKKFDVAHWIEYAAAHELIGYTYPVKYIDTDDYTERMLETGVMLFVHTVNNENDMRRYYDGGITAVYSDKVN